jgi:hypothetical protein
VISPLLRRLVQANLLILAMAVPALHAQSQVDTAHLELPDAPVPQGDLVRMDDDVFSSSLPDSPQAQSPVPAAPTAADQKPMTEAEKKALAEAEAQKELHQRMAGIVPNFNAVLDGVSVPLSPKQKIRAAFRSAIDPYQFALAGFTSGIGQAMDSHSYYDPQRMINVGYSQGWVGYSQRFGASFTDQFDGTMIGNGILPIILHQDPRYYRLGTGTFKHRALYAASTAVRTKSDKGKWQPNYSNILGNIAAGGISNLYYPAHDRGFSLTIEQGVEVTAEGIFGAMLIEFYPDIRKHFQGKKKSIDTPIVAPAATN